MITRSQKYIVSLLLAVLVVLVGISLVINYRQGQIAKQQTALLNNIACLVTPHTTDVESRGITYNDLANGWYTTICVVNEHNGIAMLRRHLPMNDIDLIVSNVPPSGLDPGASHHILN